MTTAQDHLISSTSRKLTIRRRPDLEIRSQQFGDRAAWVVKDPVGLRYFRLQEQEFAILEMLDGESSLDELRARFQRRFVPEQITTAELHTFITSLHRWGLVVSDEPGQGQQLLARAPTSNTASASPRSSICSAFVCAASIRISF